MGIIKEDEYFPRGRSTSSKPALRRVKDSLFKKYKKPKNKIKKNKFYEEKQSKSEKKTKLTEKEQPRVKHLIKPLTYQSLEEGMVMVSRIREIWPYYMFLCLPGRLSAKVSVAAISEPYTQSLTLLRNLEITQKECPPLNELFQVGQSVVCSIVEVKKERTNLSVSVSLEPSLVNKDRGHHSVRAGMTLVAAVLSVEDHGYTLHTGINGLIAFLRKSNAERYMEQCTSGRHLVVGELLRCLVTKCTTSRSSTRVEVTIDPDKVAKAVLSDVSPQALQPAANVRCTVEQAFSAGLVVSLGGSEAYIETSQLTDCWSLPHMYSPKTELTANVLYVLPHVNFQMSVKPTYLTLKDINEVVTPKLAIGDVLTGIVTSSGRRGAFLCLGDKKDNEIGNKGFVSIRRLGDGVDKQNVASKFPRGKLVITRILAFDYMEQIYNCSLEREKLEQQYVRMDQLKVGNRVSCEVIEVEDGGLKLALGAIRLYAFKEHSADVPYMNLVEHFAVGDIVDGRILRINPELRQVSVTLKETLIRSPMLHSYAVAQVGDNYWGTVRRVRDTGVVVGFYSYVIGLLQLSTRHESFFPGQLVKCCVTYVNVQEEKLLLSLSPKHPQPTKQLLLGNLYELVVTDTSADYLTVSACDFDGVAGLVPRCHIHNRSAYVEGDFLKAWLYQKRSGTLYFSPDPAIKDFLKTEENIEPGSRLTCCVAKLGSKKISLFTSLPDFPVAEIPRSKCRDCGDIEVHQLLQLYVEHIDSSTLVLSRKKPTFPLVTTREPVKNEVLSDLDEEKLNDCNNSIEMSSPEEKSKKKKKKESRKQRSVEVKEIDNNLLQPNNDSSTRKEDITREKIADTVDAVSPKNKHLKKKKKKDKVEETAAHTSASELDEQSEQEEIEHHYSLRERKKKSEGDIPGEQSTNILFINKGNTDINSSPEVPVDEIEQKLNNIEAPVNKSPLKRWNWESESDSESEEDCSKKTKKQKQKHGPVASERINKDGVKLTLSESGFLWDVKPEDLNKPVEEPMEEEDEGEEEVNKGKKKKTAAERRRAAKEEEARLREVEQTLLESESNPQSVDQFDRAVLARPDDADLWIKYMSHHLQATEIEKARAVARRALQTINQRLEVERLNVWIALLNLEHLFGTQESLKNTLEEALRTNDEFTVYSKMLHIYSQADKSQEAEQLVNLMVRKFRTSDACWLHCCSALMQVRLADKARSLLHRAISALPTKEHVNLLCKFALLENQHGFSEQAQTLFEHILTSYPKRVDVWSVYVDMLVKADKLDIARQILERASRQKLPTRKMKILFNKWINFEEKHGTPERVEHVRKQAQAYVNNIMTKLE